MTSGGAYNFNYFDDDTGMLNQLINQFFFIVA